MRHRFRQTNHLTGFDASLSFERIWSTYCMPYHLTFLRACVCLVCGMTQNWAKEDGEGKSKTILIASTLPRYAALSEKCIHTFCNSVCPIDRTTRSQGTMINALIWKTNKRREGTEKRQAGNHLLINKRSLWLFMSTIISYNLFK